ncbi:MAG: FdtA/QdtA family cupin domain-containing protein [Syntrophomonadaceae bacterium]|nr:FdtA/QdtA family cupin domain-containing protein [Syntrophomonadaceae bacterium]
MELTTFNFKMRGDERGSLVAIEENRDIPFAIKRVYYIFGTGEAVIRGLHAHKTLRQVMICIHGTCSLLLDNGTDKIVVPMHDRDQGILIDAMVWHEMYNFSPDCVLLVLAGDFYDESDYLRDYNEFLSVI